MPLSAVLLDTHVLVWLLSGNNRLGSKSRSLIQDAANAGVLYLSAISPWEIAVLVSKGRLILAQDVGLWIQAALALPGIQLAPLSPEIAVASARLPGIIHPDPADRIIAATTRQLGAVLVTADGLLIDYGAAGHLRAFRAEF
ncbi:MAG: VapC toxin family PIN domain ribonuclease [Candidatus Accumulibacter sp.]|nr:VapC toxin family PIN domain ribonuclease [Accumulibacter sp.]